MEVFGILGYLFGLRALNEAQNLREEVETIQIKDRWKREQCSRGIHFRYKDNCSACGVTL